MLILLPTLLAISLIVFFISIHSPGDPALQNLEKESAVGSSFDRADNSLLLEKSRNMLGLDKPAFYFSLATKATPDSLFEIPFERERQMVEKLSYKTGRPELVMSYYGQLKSLPAQGAIYNLLGETNIHQAESYINNLGSQPKYLMLKKLFDEMLHHSTIINRYVPTLHYYGLDNQYHAWLSSLLAGDMGKSYRDGQSVASKVGSALKWTVGLSISALLFVYIVSISLAVLSAYYENWFSSVLSSLFLVLYSIPTFIVATLLVIIVGSSGLFPVYGLGEVNDSMDFWEVASVRISHLFLPLLCLSYIPISFLYQQLYTNLKEVLKRDYIVVAKAKGLSRLKVINKHALKNSLLPMITYISNIFPAIVGGSFVVEFVFSIPGMGMLTLDSIYARDYPSIFAILLIVSFVGLLGSLLSDILFMVFDPRINLADNKKLESVG